MRLARLLLLILLPCAVAQAQKAPQPVPEYFNLGPLGGKCTSQLAAAGQPAGLLIAKVTDSAPAAKAGLKPGDVLTGCADNDFGKNPWRELALAIETAEAAEDHSLKLKAQRGTETLQLTATLAPPAKASAGGLAPGAALRDKLIADALAWLARQQQPDGSWQNNFSVENGLVVQTSLAGLCFLAAGFTPEKGDYATELRKAAEFVLETVGEQKQYKRLQGKNNDQTHWSLGYGAIFLAHVQHQTDAKWLAKSSLKGIKSKLKWIAGRIQSGMEDGGGFGHGPGGPNALDYIELEAMSNLLLSALGCMQRCGIEPDAKKLDKMLEFARACTDEDGNVAYSTTAPQSAVKSPARSAALANAMASLRKTDDPIYAKVQGCAQRNVEHAFDGHSTPTMHQLAFAMAAWRGGADNWAEYWKHNRVELTMARNPGGSFAYRPTPETAMMGTNLDRDLTEVWTTGHWVLILCLEKGGLPLWCSK